MSEPKSQRLAAPLALRLPADADAAQVAAAVVGAWQEIDEALRPVIGQRGAAALYRRTLFLTAPGHSVLAGLHDHVRDDIDSTALHAALATAPLARARDAGDALLHTLHTLLASLIGASLTERLLRRVWDNSTSSAPAQDPS